MVFCWVFDGFLVVFWWVFDGFLVGFWWFFGGFLVETWFLRVCEFSRVIFGLLFCLMFVTFNL